jgi:outer membrane protein OmpA-like peptidoglycan-associated protein
MRFNPATPVRHLFSALACLTAALVLLTGVALAQDGPFKGGWALDTKTSALRFQSVKNATIVESSSFATMTGAISEGGVATVSILLDSVDTAIDLRNVRMRFLFFETFTYPQATITAQLDTALLDGLEETKRKLISLPYRLDLHGVTKDLTAQVMVTLLDGARVSVATATPISISAADFNLAGGVAKLEEAANVVIIPSATVSFDLLFTRQTGQSAAPQAPAAKPASAALETAGDFDLEACLGRFEILSRSGNIYFQPGSARLESASAPILAAIVDIIRRCPQLRVQVAGHTDAIGPASDNQRLSEERAQAVSDYFIAQGISAKRFRVIGYGEARPTADNATREGRSRNRRIEFTGVAGE